jgi:hypothetical protein
MTGVFSKRFSRKECFRCLVDATPSRTELQVSPCWQLLTSQVVWFFPFFLFYFWYSFSLFCLVFVQRRVFLVSGDWGGWMRILGNFFETDSHRFWSRFSFCSKHSTSISILPLGSITCLLILLYTPWSAKSLNCLKKKKCIYYWF